MIVLGQADKEELVRDELEKIAEEGQRESSDDGDGDDDDPDEDLDF